MVLVFTLLACSFPSKAMLQPGSMESGLYGSPRSDGFADVYYLCHMVNKEYMGGIRLHP